MKLIFCPKCQDVKKLQLEITTCRCNNSWGKYLDGINAEIGGDAIPIGISNSSLAEAIVKETEYKESVVPYYRPLRTKGFEFTAFIIPKNCESVKKEGQCPE